MASGKVGLAACVLLVRWRLVHSAPLHALHLHPGRRMDHRSRARARSGGWVRSKVPLGPALRSCQMRPRRSGCMPAPAAPLSHARMQARNAGTSMLLERCRLARPGLAAAGIPSFGDVALS